MGIKEAGYERAMRQKEMEEVCVCVFFYFYTGGDFYLMRQ